MSPRTKQAPRTRVSPRPRDGPNAISDTRNPFTCLLCRTKKPKDGSICGICINRLAQIGKAEANSTDDDLRQAITAGGKRDRKEKMEQLARKLSATNQHSANRERDLKNKLRVAERSLARKDRLLRQALVKGARSELPPKSVIERASSDQNENHISIKSG